MRIFKHLSKSDRLRIETMTLDGKGAKEIAERVHVHISTIYREWGRGAYTHKNTDWTYSEFYSADKAEQKYRANLAAKGAPLKIGNDRKLADYIEAKIINDKYSPDAVIGEIKHRQLDFSVTICTSTLYSYIEKGIFLKLTNKHLPVKGTKKRKYNHVREVKRAPKGESIENRPAEIAERSTFGHWEMDTVKGKQTTKNVILVLTERLTRQEIKIKMADGTTASTVKALDSLERRYGEMFKSVFRTITVDNGSEFADHDGMKKSAIRPGDRTTFYYCHPYSSYERGSNENANKLIRRWIPKGTPIEDYTEDEIQRIEDWINNYPRRIFGYATASERFSEHVKSLS